MIKCNRCGMMSAAGSVNCQSCGAPLPGQGETGFGSRMGAGAGSQGQPELPAWLETLRPGERPVAPASSSSSFSTADFVEEGTLPSWMRAQRDDSQQTGEQAASGLRSAAQPAPTTDSGTFSASAFTAQSLIDVQGLPAWMQEGSISMTPPPQSGAAIPDQAPDWMKALQPQQRPVRDVEPAVGNEQLMGRAGPPESPSSASGFSARDLVDQQALPSWMTSQGNPGQPQASSGTGPTGYNGAPAQQAAPSWNQPAAAQPAPTIQPGQIGFSARDLVDQQALPSWMASQSNPGQPQPPTSSAWKESMAQPGPAPQSNTPPQSGQGNFSASSLLDMDSLPPWLRDGGQQQAGNVAPPAANASGLSWGAQPQNAAGMAANSFIDPNALPEWMRGDAGQAGTGPQAGFAGQRPSPYTPGASRAENMRVPNRPRGEVNANENSEVAANVFASMLGVASTAPNYPQPNPPGSPVPPAGAGASYPPAGQPGMQQSNMGNRPSGTVPGTPGAMPQGQAYPQPSGSGGYPGQAYPPPASGQYASNIGVPQYPPQMGGTANMGNMPDDAGDQKGKKKRGLFGAFLDWFSRDSQR